MHHQLEACIAKVDATCARPWPEGCNPPRLSFNEQLPLFPFGFFFVVVPSSVLFSFFLRKLATPRSKGASGLSREADADDSPANNLLDSRCGDPDWYIVFAFLFLNKIEFTIWMTDDKQHAVAHCSAIVGASSSIL